MADWIPKINVRQGLKQVGSVVGLAPKADYDLIDNWSVRGGDRSPASGGVAGKTNPTPSKHVPFGDDVIVVGDSGVGAGAGGGVRYGGGGAAVDPDAALRQQFKDRISGRGGEIEAAYAALFGDLDTLLRARDSELETQYGEQLKKAADAYAGALPTIENSYAALGAADSTDLRDANISAKEGFEDTTKTIGKNKQKDKAALGQYGNEQRAKFTADRDAARRAISSAGETTDVGALRGLSNDLDTNLSTTGVTRATLGTDGSAQKAISSLTQDAGRFDSAINALDSLLKGSMSGDVKQAGAQAIMDAGGLSEDEKQRVRQTYGDVYSEQAAL